MRGSRYHVDVRVERPFAGLVSGRWLARIVRRVLEAEGVPAVELGIVISDDETLRRLNRDYAGEDEVTDVLSFSLGEGEASPSPLDGLSRLGEVVIAYPTAQRQAAQQGHSPEREVAQLLIHGVLHLLGYDHAEPEDEQRMRAKEEALLAAVSLKGRGFAKP